MAANQKLIIQYVQFDDEWKEVYYMQADTVQQAMNALDKNFTDAAVAFRNNNVYVASLRVSDVNQPRSALQKRLLVPNIIPGGLAPDTKNTACVCALRSQNSTLQRHVWFRGLNDADRTRNPNTGQDQPIGNLLPRISDFVANMNRVGIYIRALLPIVHDATYDFWPFTSITVNPDQTVSLLVANALVPIGPSSRVIISQMDPKKFPGLNGHWKVTVTAPNMKIPGYLSTLAPNTYALNKGRYRVEEFRYQKVDLFDPAGASQFVSLGTRNTKSGPFGGRGRKKGVSLRSR